jgi:hypothetical protein
MLVQLNQRSEGKMANLNELTQFIVHLSENPAQVRRFKADPNSVIEKSGLSEETKKLLLSAPEVLLSKASEQYRLEVAKPNVTTNVQTVVNTQTNTSTHVNVNTNNQTTTWVALVMIP